MVPTKRSTLFYANQHRPSSFTLCLCLCLFPLAEYKWAKGGVKAPHHAGLRRLHAQLCSAHQGQSG
ncbi:hypothetical protein DFAR_630076 [Desulfarculales bacterium]